MLRASTTLLSIARDVTGRKKLEDSLYRSKERYKKLIELLPDAVFIHDQDRIIFANNPAAKLCGVENYEKLLGVNISSLVPLN